MEQDIDAFQKAVSSIYSASLTDKGWERAIDAVASFVGNRAKGVVQAYDLANPTPQSHSMFASVNYNIDYFYNSPEIFDFWMSNDPWGPAVAALDDNRVVLGTEVCVPEEFKNTPFWKEVWSKSGIGGLDVAGSIVNLHGVDNLFLIYSDERDPVFSAEDRRRMWLLYPHIERAMAVRSKLETLKHQLIVSQSHIDQLHLGVAHLDSGGQITYVNAAADRLFSSERVFRVTRKKLSGVDLLENNQIQGAVNLAMGVRYNGILNANGVPQASVLNLFGQNEMRPWTVSFAPTPATDAFNGLFRDSSAPKVIICISDQQPVTDIHAETVAKAFNLTPQETFVASRIAAGDTLKSLADETGRSVETYRTHTKAIFAKTGTSSQADIVRLVMSAPVQPQG